MFTLNVLTYMWMHNSCITKHGGSCFVLVWSSCGQTDVYEVGKTRLHHCLESPVVSSLIFWNPGNTVSFLTAIQCVLLLWKNRWQQVHQQSLMQRTKIWLLWFMQWPNWHKAGILCLTHLETVYRAPPTSSVSHRWSRPGWTKPVTIKSRQILLMELILMHKENSMFFTNKSG